MVSYTKQCRYSVTYLWLEELIIWASKPNSKETKNMLKVEVHTSLDACDTYRPNSSSMLCGYDTNPEI